MTTTRVDKFTGTRTVQSSHLRGDDRCEWSAQGWRLQDGYTFTSIQRTCVLQRWRQLHDDLASEGQTSRWIIGEHRAATEIEHHSTRVMRGGVLEMWSIVPPEELLEHEGPVSVQVGAMQVELRPDSGLGSAQCSTGSRGPDSPANGPSVAAAIDHLSCGA
ncbi:MAG: hypothetical protein HC927_07150 [Deltaproteobacteria bacterium]|nr:hypothetical protein [Deltaproteobacteria bacterium]